MIKQGMETDSREGNMKDKNEKRVSSTKNKKPLGINVFIYLFIYLFIHSFIFVAIKYYIHYSRFTQ
jgi:hypothetical protein